ncbi:ras guanine nucleotide exchange factor i-related [Anaeramoeba flamelloides]|uniref:Ras guanine nucleotide exchange factor i-related n=1 Tax=Anaeramoeba flamelloides TaxID=1746091 RepID=A0ABQ8Y5X9_9EUKA|nr:ras guanine nucleotide exchange factor i-related [Anaeramoeba flamelloides]
MTNSPLRASDFLKSMDIPQRRTNRRRNRLKKLVTQQIDQNQTQTQTQTETQPKQQEQTQKSVQTQIQPKQQEQEKQMTQTDNLQTKIQPKQQTTTQIQEKQKEETQQQTKTQTTTQIKEEEEQQQQQQQQEKEKEKEIQEPEQQTNEQMIENKLPQQRGDKYLRTLLPPPPDYPPQTSQQTTNQNKEQNLTTQTETQTTTQETQKTQTTIEKQPQIKKKSKVEELLGISVSTEDKVLKNKKLKEEMEKQKEKELQEQFEAKQEHEMKKMDWLPFVLQKHPSVLDLREKIIPLTKETSFGRLISQSKTEVKDNLSTKQVLGLIMQHFNSVGLKKSLRSLENESSLRSEEMNSKKSKLFSLLQLGVTDMKKIWNLSTEEIDEIEDNENNKLDPEVYINNEFVGLGYEESQIEAHNVNIWEEGPESSENIIYANGSVKAATLNKLIEKLTPGGKSDTDYLHTFLMSYQSFTTPRDFLDKLIERYHVPKRQDQKFVEYQKIKKTIQISIGRVLKKWIETYFSDFNHRLISEMSNFIDNVLVNDGNENLAKLLRSSINKMQKDSTLNRIGKAKTNPPDPITPKNIWSPDLKLDDIDEEEIARQETLIEHQMYLQIKPTELLKEAWSKENAKIKSPNVLNLIKRFESIANWVTFTIVDCPTIKERIKHICSFIRLGDRLLKLENFHGLRGIVVGLSSEPVSRLKFTWNEVPKNDKKLFNTFKEIIPNNNSYIEYIRIIDKINDKPCIPNLDYYLKELSIREKTQDDYIGKLINFAKRRKIYETVTRLNKFQLMKYSLISIHQIKILLNDLPQTLTKEELLSKSLRLEPLKGSRNNVK